MVYGRLGVTPDAVGAPGNSSPAAVLFLFSPQAAVVSNETTAPAADVFGF
jgi:hypothetical protein